QSSPEPVPEPVSTTYAPRCSTATRPSTSPGPSTGAVPAGAPSPRQPSVSGLSTVTPEPPNVVEAVRAGRPPRRTRGRSGSRGHAGWLGGSRGYQELCSTRATGPDGTGSADRPPRTRTSVPRLRLGPGAKRVQPAWQQPSHQRKLLR